jgi:hypothetical protein
VAQGNNPQTYKLFQVDFPGHGGVHGSGMITARPGKPLLEFVRIMSKPLWLCNGSDERQTESFETRQRRK